MNGLAIAGYTSTVVAISLSQQTAGESSASEGVFAMSEETLVLRLRRGEPAAVSECYDRHHRMVRACAKRLIGDFDLAEDVVHEVFVAVPKAVRRFRGEAPLRTFLLAITVRRAKKAIRSAARRRRAMERLAAQPEPNGTTPEALAIQRELVVALQRALDGLPHAQRVAFVLCDVEQRTAAEAARIVDAPEATVRTRLFHARRKLRSSLSKRGVR
ncbi:MAG: RNA polymerase sigma factor [Myxococcota bacterium]